MKRSDVGLFNAGVLLTGFTTVAFADDATDEAIKKDRKRI